MQGEMSVLEEVITMLFQEKFGINEQSAVKESGRDPSRRRPRRIHSKRTRFL